MSKIVLSLLFFCVSLLSFSQGPTFSGSVIEEESNAKMANAIVSIEGTSLASTTDENGKFSFNEKIPSGDHVVTVSKDGYELKLFMIEVDERKTLTTNPIELTVTNKERKRRKKANKSADKEARKLAKEKEKKLKTAKKELEKREKKLAKQKKKLKKKNKDVVINYDAVEPNVPSKEVTVNPVVTNDDDYSGLQIKYANMIGVTPQEISNLPLYEFIDGWMGTPYLWGGTNKEGIDCSSFTQRLYQSVYDQYIERTADAQQASKYTNVFEDTSYLKEGDLLFFGDVDTRSITHVGVYLGNNKFVNATTRKTDGVAGVKIDDITDPFWRSIFCCGGKRINNN